MTSAIDLFIEEARAVTVLDVAAIRSRRIFPSIPCRIALSLAWHC
ncbi:hypothetical protein [Neorhizobium tomejilense]